MLLFFLKIFMCASADILFGSRMQFDVLTRVTEYALSKDQTVILLVDKI